MAACLPSKQKVSVRVCYPVLGIDGVFGVEVCISDCESEGDEFDTRKTPLITIN